MRKKKPEIVMPPRLTNASSLGLYNGAELRRNAGITDDRMYAYTLPSRIGDRLIYPKEKK